MTDAEQSNLNAALIAAIKDDDTDAVIALLAKGANPNITTEIDPWGYGARTVSALILAITWFLQREMRGTSVPEFNAPLVHAVIEGGANLETNLPDEEPPLQCIIGYGDLCPGRYELVSLMLDRGVDIDAVYMGYTALHVACSSQDVAMIEFLLDRGANINPATAHDSPLMRAVRAKQKETVKLLLARGANVHYRSRSGETALSLAQTKRKVVVEIRKLLEAAGAQPDLLEEECRQLIRTVEEAEDLDPTIPERWQQLWHANLEGENFNHAPLHHAQLLCRLGVDLAMFQNDYAAAIDLLNRLQAHPNAHRLTTTEYCDLYEDKLYCLLMGGEESEAILLARRWMEGEAKAPRIEGWMIEQCVGRALVDYFEAQIEPQVVVLISTPCRYSPTRFWNAPFRASSSFSRVDGAGMGPLTEAAETSAQETETAGAGDSARTVRSFSKKGINCLCGR